MTSDSTLDSTPEVVYNIRLPKCRRNNVSSRSLEIRIDEQSTYLISNIGVSQTYLMNHKFPYGSTVKATLFNHIINGDASKVETCEFEAGIDDHSMLPKNMDGEYDKLRAELVSAEIGLDPDYTPDPLTPIDLSGSSVDDNSGDTDDSDDPEEESGEGETEQETGSESDEPEGEGETEGTEEEGAEEPEESEEEETTEDT